MHVFYNADTRPDCANGIQYPPRHIDTTSPFYKFDLERYKRQQNEDTSGIHGEILVMIDGKLCGFMQVPAWAMKPLRKGEHGRCPGINWGEEYFTTREEAEAFAASLKTRYDQPQYHHMTDLWSINYHY